MSRKRAATLFPATALLEDSQLTWLNVERDFFAMWNRNLVILLVAQTIAVTGSVLIVTIGGLIGATLSTNHITDGIRRLLVLRQTVLR